MKTLVGTVLCILSMFVSVSLLTGAEIVSKPTGVAVDSRDNIYLISKSEIQVYSPERKFVRKLNVPIRTKHRPENTRIAIDNEDTIIVSDNDCIYSVPQSKKGWLIEGKGPCKFGGLTVDSKGKILVANMKAERVEIYSPEGKLISTISKKTVKVKEGDKEIEKEIGEPRDVFVRDGRLYVAHRDGVTIWKYDPETAKAEYEEFIENKWDTTSCVVDSNGRLYVARTSNSFWCYEIGVRVFERGDNGKWKSIADYNGDPYRFLVNPQDLAVNSKDDILIADTGNNRILIENAATFDGPPNNYSTWEETFEAELPKIKEITRTSAKISWTTNEKMDSGVFYHTVGKSAIPKTKYVHTNPGTEHSVLLKGLEPGTRYKIFLAPFGRNIPHAKGSRYYTFVTKPPEKKTAYIKLPVLAVVFKNIIIAPEGVDEKDIPKTRTPDEEIEKIRRELDAAELFYWVNSGLRMCLDIEMLVIDDFYFEAPLENYFYPRVEGHKKIRKMLVDRKINARDYGGVCVLNCVRHFNAKTKEFTYDRGSGGGTIGTYPPIEGFCSWRGFSNNTWLFTHEFGHSFDIKFQRSGMAEYPINHFMIDGDYGTHYDGIAYQSRIWSERWLRMSFGDLVLADDKDEDGIPDDDPDVPLDEKRFDSDPGKMDTDGDGLNDYDEMMASKWIWDGENDRTADGYFKPGPRNKDTDGDGIEDGKDKYPLYPYPTEIYIKEGPTARSIKFAQIKDPALNATISLSWNKDNLVFNFDLDRPANINIRLDPKNDGRMAEWDKDNYYVNFKHDASKMEGRAPKGVDIAKIQATRYISGTNSTQSISISIPANADNGLTLKKGDTVGFLIYFRPKDYKGKEITLFEPNAWFDITLEE